MTTTLQSPGSFQTQAAAGQAREGMEGAAELPTAGHGGPTPCEGPMALDDRDPGVHSSWDQVVALALRQLVPGSRAHLHPGVRSVTVPTPTSPPLHASTHWPLPQPKERVWVHQCSAPLPLEWGVPASTCSFDWIQRSPRKTVLNVAKREK